MEGLLSWPTVLFGMRESALDWWNAAMAAWPSNPLTILITLLPFAIPLAMTFRARRWTSVVAVLALAFAATLALVAMGSEGAATALGQLPTGWLRLETLAPFAGGLTWGFCLLAALVIGIEMRHLRRRRARDAKMLAVREKRIAELDEALFHERFWRKAAGDERHALPPEDILDLARRVQEPILRSQQNAAKQKPDHAQEPARPSVDAKASNVGDAVFVGPASGAENTGRALPRAVDFRILSDAPPVG